LKEKKEGKEIMNNMKNNAEITYVTKALIQIAALLYRGSLLFPPPRTSVEDLVLSTKREPSSQPATKRWPSGL
jgi:hypothetical protein